MINRRSFLALGGGAALNLGAGKLWGLAPIPMPTANGAMETKLDAFTAEYMRKMNAPGMTQALTDTTATLRTAGYGFANVDLQAPVTPEQLFQIGSISKSFVALVPSELSAADREPIAVANTPARTKPLIPTGITFRM